MVIGAMFVAIGGATRAGAQDSAHKTNEAWQIIPLPQSSLVFARDSSPIGEIGHEGGPLEIGGCWGVEWRLHAIHTHARTSWRMNVR